MNIRLALSSAGLFLLLLAITAGNGAAQTTTEPPTRIDGIECVPPPPVPVEGDILKPNLGLAVRGAYWASYVDYIDGKLAVMIEVTNLGSIPAYNVKITGNSNTNGVVLLDELPVTLVFTQLGAQGRLVKNFCFDVSTPGVTNFHSTFSGSAEDAYCNTYTYP